MKTKFNIDQEPWMVLIIQRIERVTGDSVTYVSETMLTVDSDDDKGEDKPHILFRLDSGRSFMMPKGETSYEHIVKLGYEACSLREYAIVKEFKRRGFTHYALMNNTEEDRQAALEHDGVDCEVIFMSEDGEQELIVTSDDGDPDEWEELATSCFEPYKHNS